MSGILAQSIPKFGLFINLSGAFSCVILAFICPVVLYNKVFEKEISTLRRRLHYCLIAFGVICGSISVFSSVVEIIKAFSEEENIVLPT